jgi:[ribosomal protein S5]-alanine N-acetyltransferase
MIEGEKLPVLEASRIRLRHLEESDIDALYAIFSDAEAMRFFGIVPFAKPADAENYLAEIHAHFEKKTLFQWGISLKPDDKIIGTTTLFHTDEKNRRAEIGFALNRRFWGKGYVTEAVNSLLKFAFEELNLHRIEADVDPRNAPSIRVLERFGFQKEGYLRERWIVQDEIQDAIFYGLLKTDRK